MKNQSHVKGFTLMELIGAMAVITVLAAVAMPQIFNAIQEARVSALIREANELSSVVARYYEDTGTWPRHTPNDAKAHQRQLMLNVANGAQAPIPGWDGPYLENDLENPINAGAFVDLLVTANTKYACDLDGDGVQDGTFIVYRVDNVGVDIAKKMSDSWDKDGGVTTGTGSWFRAGRVKTFTGSATRDDVVICLARV
ncbi:MAG: prepilin-type N-terminal cleavage/methylation domain-containing protein [Pseudomonadota bacterium]